MKPYLALAAVCLFWGTTYVAIRMALESFPPAILVSGRFIISGALLLAAAAARGAHLPNGRELGIAAVCGFLILGIGNGSLAWAELLIPSGLASLFITISPFWMVGIEAAFAGGERLHAPTIFGMLVGFAGTAMLVTPGLNSKNLGTDALVGFAITQVGVVAWAAGSIYQRRQPAKAHPVVTGAVQQLAAGLLFLPVAAMVPHASVAWSYRGVGAVIYLVVFGSIVGYSAYAYALDKLPVAVVSIYPYANTVVAVTLGWLIYREHFGAREAVAMAIIFAGVTVVKWQSRKLARP